MSVQRLSVLVAISCLLVHVASSEALSDFALESREQKASKYKKHAPKHYHKVVIAHAVLACLAWVILIPTGSIMMRILPRRAFQVHAFFQSSGITLYIAAVGMGIWMGRTTSKLDNYHSILGLVIFGLVAFQVVAGAVHHWVLYKKTSRRSSLSRIHLWLGRILITAGMINGGLGFKLSEPDWHYGVRVASTGDLIAYGVLCGVFWLTYVLIVIYTEMRPKQIKAPSSDSDSDKIQEIKRELRSSKKSRRYFSSRSSPNAERKSTQSRLDQDPVGRV